MGGTLGGKIMKGLFGLRTKAYSYLIDDDSEDKKAKDTKQQINVKNSKDLNVKDIMFLLKKLLRLL